MPSKNTLYLVRHGQASFGAQNYDQLSDLGLRQSRRLGQYWAQNGQTFDAVYTGTLARQRQTWSALAEGAGWNLAAQTWPGLNEFDGEALIAALGVPLPAAPSASTDAYRQHFRLLRQALTQWMQDQLCPRGMPSYAAFVQGVMALLEQVGRNGSGNTLIISSGGPIAAAVGQVLACPVASIIDLNLNIGNTALTELIWSGQRCKLHRFNTLAHLDGAEYAPWVTYA